MEATKGHGNPKWTRDESILALNLFHRVGGRVPEPEDAQVIALSERLRTLPVHREADKRASFRNPAGVALKLQNIRQLATGRGLANASAMDRSVWEEFGSNPSLVQRLTDAIVEETTAGAIGVAEVQEVGEGEEFAEGRILTALHRRRERNPKLRAQLLIWRRLHGGIRCDCCDREPFTAAPEELALAAFEAHHKTPLSSYAPGDKTRHIDMALVCATCHRLLHRAMHLQRRWIAVGEFREMLADWGAVDVP